DLAQRCNCMSVRAYLGRREWSLVHAHEATETKRPRGGQRSGAMSRSAFGVDLEGTVPIVALRGATNTTRGPWTRSCRPRFGSVCERLFGTTNTRFVHTLAGNAQLTRNRAKVTKSVNPKGQACWTLAALATRLCEWAYEVYDTLDHPALSQSPREAFAAGLQTCGVRPQRHIAYDEDFRMLTLPTTQKGTA